MSEVNVVKHTRPMMLKDGNRHVWPTLASMVYLRDGTTPLADENGNLTVDHTLSADNATDSEKLGGVPAAEYLTQDDAADTYLTKQAASDTYLEKDAQATDSAKLGGKPPQHYHQPLDILDNGNFTQPVNQRGQTSYTGGQGATNGYGIDRWYTNRANSILTIVSGGIEINNSANDSNTCILTQRLSLPALGNYTFIAKAGDGLIYRQYKYDGTSMSQIASSVKSEKNDAWLTISNGMLLAQLVVKAAQTTTFEYAALYVGGYTEEELPPYTPRKFETELLNCSVKDTGRVPDSSLFNGKLPEYYSKPHNYLDNSNFLKPINQRGKTSYTTSKTYTIDRWRMWAPGEAEVSVGTDGVTLTGITGSCIITQPVPDLEDGDYCFVVFAGGEIGYKNFNLTGGVYSNDNMPSKGYPGGYLQAGYYEGIGIECSIRAERGYTVTVEWAALYEGIYTPETLPPYVYKGYAAELAECQRYYTKVEVFYTSGGFYGYQHDTTTIRVVIPLSNPMRADNKPTVQFSNLTGCAVFSGGNDVNPTLTGVIDSTGFLVSKNDGMAVTLSLKTTETTLVNVPVYLKLNGTVDISRDL